MVPLHTPRHHTGKLTLVLTLIYLLGSAAVTYFYWIDRTADYQFGYEYGNVAASVVTGKGFGNVFGEGTGPTAWCPPAYVFFHAAVYAVFGVQSPAAMWALLFARVLLLTWTLFLLLKIDYSPSLNRYRYWIMPVFAVMSGLVLTKDFDDKALNVWLSVVTISLIFHIARYGFERYKVQGYALAVVLPLANLFLFAGSLLLVVLNGFRLYRRQTSPMSGKHCMILILLMVAATTTWTVRNKIALGQFIPFKSNLWFEVYMSNVADHDGLMQQSNWITHHPIANPDVAESYTEQGELQFMKRYNDEVLTYLKGNSGDFLRKVFRRSANAFVFMMSSDDLLEADTLKLPESDLEELRAHGFMIWHYWTHLDMPDEDFQNAIATMTLSNSDVVYNDWKEKKATLAAGRFSSLSRTAGGLLYALVPTIAILICLCFRDVRNLLIFRLTLYFLILSWAPYIILSHYARYQTFQVGMFTVMIFLCVAVIGERMERRREAFLSAKARRRGDGF